MQSESAAGGVYSVCSVRLQFTAGCACAARALVSLNDAAVRVLRVHARFVSPRSPRDISACARELFFFIILYNLFFFLGGALLQKRF